MLHWSRDGSRLALLQRRGDAFTLIEWDLNPQHDAVLRPLPSMAVADRNIVGMPDWTWGVNNDEVALVLDEENQSPQKTPTPDDASSSWSWSMSRYDALRTASAAATSQNGQHRLVVVNLQTQRMKPITDKANRILQRDSLTEARTKIRNWDFSKQSPAVVLTEVDQRSVSVKNDKLMWLIGSGEAQGRMLADTQSRAYEMDLDKGDVKEIYVGGPGRISNLLDLKNAGVLAAQADPRLWTWPMSDQWGIVRLVNGTRSETVLAEVRLTAELLASNRPDTVYLIDDRGTAQPKQIFELALRGKRLTALTTPALGASDCDVSADGSTIAAVLENVNTAPEISVWTSNDRAWRKLTSTSIHGPASGSIDHITWRSKDRRFEIDGLLVRPRDFDPTKRYPLLVLLTGGKATATIPWPDRFDPQVGTNAGGPPAAIFAEAGYLVLMPNHRGVIGGSSAEFSRSLIGHYGEQVTLDVEAGIDFLISRGWVDPQQIGI